MSDYFSNLGEHLHRSARRRARLNRARPVLAAAAIVVAGVVAVAALGSVRLPGYEEIAAPGPTPAAGSCSSDRPPAEIADRFSVFEGDVYDDDRIPPRIAQRVSGDLPGGPMAKVWPEAGRRAREGAGRSYWVIPALAGSCTRPAPAVCVVYEERALSLPACVEVAEVGEGAQVTAGQLGERRWFVAALVPDETELVLVTGVGSYRPSIEGNIFEARYEATPKDHDAVRLEFVTNDESERSAERGGCPGSAASLTDEPPSDRLLAMLPMFERGDLELTAGLWINALAGYPQRIVNLHGRHGRRLASRGVFEFVAAPVSHLPGTRGCAPLRDPDAEQDVPGVCLIAPTGDGAGTEYFPGCWTLDEVAAAEAFDLVTVDERDAVLYAVLPAGATDAVVVPNEGPPVPLEPEGQVHFALSHAQVLQPGFVLRYTDAGGEEVTGRPSMAPVIE